MSKIIETSVESIIGYNLNNKIHNDKQIDLLANSIKEYWFNYPIIIDKTNIIIAGHWRLEAAKKLWMKKVPCIVKDNLTDLQIKKYRLLDNKIAELSEDNIINIELELTELDDEELSGLYDFSLEVDIDDIEWNQDRGVSDKTREVECPNCEKKFSI